MPRKRADGNNYQIGIRLQAIREALDYTLVDFAKALDLSFEAYRNYERGIANIPLKVLQTLREKFSVNLNYLITGEGSMFSIKGVAKKAYLIGDALKKVRESLSLTTSEFFVFLNTIESEKELIAIENNEREVTQELIEDIAESYSVRLGYFLENSPPIFRSKKVSLDDLPQMCRVIYKSYRPAILFTTPCRTPEDPIYFAIFLQGDKPFQGILLYENVDFALWREWSYTAKELKNVIQSLYNLGAISVCIIEKELFHRLITGKIHSLKAFEQGKMPTFPFIPALLREDVRKKLHRPISVEGSDDYGLARLIELIE